MQDPTERNFLQRLPQMYKAVAAFVSLLVPFLTAVGTSLQDGTVTANEWTTIAVAGVALGAGTRAVWWVKNKKV